MKYHIRTSMAFPKKTSLSLAMLYILQQTPDFIAFTTRSPADIRDTDYFSNGVLDLS